MGTVFTILGSVVSAMGQIAAGNQAMAMAKAEQQRMNYMAQLKEMKAQEERAYGQQQAMQKRTQKKLGQSQAQAYAAAGGFDPSDQNTEDIIRGIEEEGELQAQLAYWGGDVRGKHYEYGAEADRYSGEIALMAGKHEKRMAGIGAFGTILGGFSKIPSFGGSSYTSQFYAPTRSTSLFG